MTGRTWKTITCLLLLTAAGCLGWYAHLAKRAGTGWIGKAGPSSLVSRADRLVRDVERLQSRAANLPEAKKRLETAREEAAGMAAIMARGDDPGTLADTIREQAARAEATPRWIQIRSVPVSGGGDFTAWRYSLFLEGTYDQLASFMNGMEQLDQFRPADPAGGLPFFEITDLNISGNGADAGRHQCTLVMFTYRPDGEWLKRERD